MSRDVRVVCFDWGGVILRICRNWREGCSRAGLPMHEEIMAAEIIARRRALSQQYQIGALTSSEFFDAVSDSTQGLYSPSDVRRIHDAWLIDEYPGVAHIVGALTSRDDVQTALLSNTNAAHWSRQHDGQHGFPTAAQLQHRLASHELRVAKPNRSIYTLATERFEVDPAQIIFFDDLEENIAAARDCGWQAQQIDHLGDTAAQIIQHLNRIGIELD